jgi:hypothetical protein
MGMRDAIVVWRRDLVSGAVVRIRVDGRVALGDETFELADGAPTPRPAGDLPWVGHGRWHGVISDTPHEPQPNRPDWFRIWDSLWVVARWEESVRGSDMRPGERAVLAVTAVEPKTGKVAWRHRVHGEDRYRWEHWFLQGEHLLFPTRETCLLDPPSGGRRWILRGDRLRDVPSDAQGCLVVLGHELLGVDGADGTIRWRARLPEPRPDRPCDHRLAAVTGRYVIWVGLPVTLTLTSARIQGKYRPGRPWGFYLDRYGESDCAADTTQAPLPTVALAVYHRSTGSVAWNHEWQVTAGTLPDRRVVDVRGDLVITHEEGSFYGRALADGTVRWCVRADADELQPPFAPAYEGWLEDLRAHPSSHWALLRPVDHLTPRFLDAATGQRVDVPGAIYHDPNNDLVLARTGNRLTCYALPAS